MTKPTARQARAAKRKAPKKRAATRKKPGQTSKSPPKKAPTAPPAASQEPADLGRTVASLVLAGLTKPQVRAFLAAESNYKPPAGDLDKIIERAKRDLVAQAEHYADVAGELALVRLNELYVRASAADELKVALDVQRAILTLVAAKIGGREPEIPSSGADDPAAEPVQPGRPRLAGDYSAVMGRHRRA